MKFFSGIFGFIVMLLAVAFALSNRHEATISLWPLGVEIQAPLYLLTLGTLLVGIVIGSAITWFGMVPHRLRARRLGKDIAALQTKVANLQQTVIPPSSQESDNNALLAGPRPKRRFWGAQP